MIELELKPGTGAGSIKLGSRRSDVRQQLAELGYPLCYENGAIDYFCDNSLQLEYENKVLRFIGISDHQHINCTYYGVDVFDTEAKKLFQLFASREIAVPFERPGETCFFPHQGLNLWEADEQYDRKGSYKRPLYAQIGVEAPEASRNA